MGTNRSPSYELFFAPIEVEFDPTIYERVQFAYFVSKYGHATQRRDGGTRYFDHPKAAAWIYIDELRGRDPDLIIDILLHDLSEDTYLLSPYRISRNFGAEIALDIRALTKLPKGKETTSEYLHRIIARGPRVILAKLCDRLHNLRSLDTVTDEKRDRTITETKQFHIPRLVTSLKQHGDDWFHIATVMESKITEAVDSY